MIVGLDAGQTGIRAVAEGGAPGPQVLGVRRMEGAVGPDDVADGLIVALETVAGDEPISAIGIGLSGFELASDCDLTRIAARLRAAADARMAASVASEDAIERGRARPSIAIASDGVTSLLGAFGGPRPGVVVAVGTGVVVLGHDGDGGWAKVDGWGSLLGDDGSGFFVGAAGLRAALRDFDGRVASGSRVLRAAAEKRWGSMDAVPGGVLRDDVATSRIVASFAPAVADAALAGDAVARSIWDAAGTGLAESAAAACARLFAAGTAVDVAPLGNLWNAGPLLADPFERALVARWPEARTVTAAGTSLGGAIELARPDGPAAVSGLLWRG
ncbi:MAG: N-acetylglucosamine kinase eukaryotic type [Solirubrobacterales bacterium]|nr:N-acetylglucosamine kinase eukaryotic type [Solirubrobacterales bacterium]